VTNAAPDENTLHVLPTAWFRHTWSWEVDVVGRHFRVQDADVAAHDGVDDLAHRQHDPTQEHEALARLEAAPLHLDTGGIGEQLILQVLDLTVEGLHRGEVSVDDVVEQSVQKEGDTMAGEVSAVVPSIDQAVHIEALVLTDRDQRLGKDERRGSCVVSSPDAWSRCTA
jgi:hypothetical protein